jgi:single-strand DNA-binding protein
MLNRVILIGRLTKDPELKYTPNGVAVASFTLAVDRFRTNAQGEREADFIPIVVWQKQAENCANYLSKGSLAAVDGRMQVRSYDGKDGQRRWVTEVIAESVRFLDKKGDSKPAGPGALGNEIGFSDDDVPF